MQRRRPGTPDRRPPKPLRRGHHSAAKNAAYHRPGREPSPPPQPTTATEPISSRVELPPPCGRQLNTLTLGRGQRTRAGQQRNVCVDLPPPGGRQLHTLTLGAGVGRRRRPATRRTCRPTAPWRAATPHNHSRRQIGRRRRPATDVCVRLPPPGGRQLHTITFEAGPAALAGRQPTFVSTYRPHEGGNSTRSRWGRCQPPSSASNPTIVSTHRPHAGDNSTRSRRRQGLAAVAGRQPEVCVDPPPLWGRQTHTITLERGRQPSPASNPMNVSTHRPQAGGNSTRSRRRQGLAAVAGQRPNLRVDPPPPGGRQTHTITLDARPATSSAGSPTLVSTHRPYTGGNSTRSRWRQGRSRSPAGDAKFVSTYRPQAGGNSTRSRWRQGQPPPAASNLTIVSTYRPYAGASRRTRPPLCPNSGTTQRPGRNGAAFSGGLLRLGRPALG
jgi:hypothetical protein